MLTGLRIKAAIATAACLTLLGGTAAYASHVFSDVPTSNGFHDSISFMKANGLTQGCNAEGTLYCPQQNVTRAQMAAFLERTVKLLTPTVISAGTYPNEVFIPPGNGLTTMCATPDVVYDDNQQIVVNAAWSVWNTSAPEAGPIDVRAYLQWSYDGGTTWLPNDLDYTHTKGSYLGEEVNPGREGGGALTAAPSPSGSIDDGEPTIRLRIGISQSGAPGAQGYCQLTATISHRG